MTYNTNTDKWSTCGSSTVDNKLSFTLNNTSYEIRWTPCNNGKASIELTDFTQHCVNSEGLPETINCS